MNNNIEILKSIWESFSLFWWIVLPILFYYPFKIIWKDYVIDSWIDTLEWTVLEVIPPKEFEKGPKVMELIYQAISGVLVTFNTFDEWLAGKTTDRFSFELVSLGGEVHFYIRTQKKFRNLIESQIYAQYPGAEIFEVEDYMQNFPKVVPNRDWDVWGSDIILSEPDPFPIRTYESFLEDITGTMIDPVAGFVELFASVPPGQNLMWQMVMYPLSEGWRKDQIKHVNKLAGRDSAKSGGLLADLLDVIVNIFKGFSGPVEFSKAAKKEEQPLQFRLTHAEAEQLKALEVNIAKNAYEVKMRFINLGLKDGFDGTFQTAFFGIMREFSDLGSNNLRPDNTKTTASYVAINSRLQTMKRRIYNRYRNRNMDGNTFTFSTTEFATVYHLPDMGVVTPTMPRVDSKKGTAPFNLPIE